MNLPALAAIATAITLGRAALWFWRIEHAQDDIEDET